MWFTLCPSMITYHMFFRYVVISETLFSRTKDFCFYFSHLKKEKKRKGSLSPLCSFIPIRILLQGYITHHITIVMPKALLSTRTKNIQQSTLIYEKCLKVAHHFGSQPVVARPMFYLVGLQRFFPPYYVANTVVDF